MPFRDQSEIIIGDEATIFLVRKYLLHPNFALACPQGKVNLYTRELWRLVSVCKLRGQIINKYDEGLSRIYSSESCENNET